MAVSAGPSVQFEDPGLAFALVQLGRQVSQQITIRNTSQHSSASWALHVLPQHAGHSEVSTLNWTAQQAQHASSTDASGFTLAAQHAGNHASMALSNPAMLGSSETLSNTAAFETQHAQQAAGTALGGMPAALHAKEQQLMQQLQEAQMTDQEADLAADAAASATAATGDLAADGFAMNPFEAGEEQQGSGCRLCMKPDLGVLAPGASTSVQVTSLASMPSRYPTMT